MGEAKQKKEARQLGVMPGVPREIIEQLTRTVADQGLLIEAGWLSMRATAIPSDAPAAQLEAMRMAFFGGAQHLFGSIMTFLDEGEDPTPTDVERMNKISLELQQFIAEFTLRHSRPEGSA